MRSTTAALLTLALLGAVPAAAQAEGSRVRVAPSWRVADDRWIVGTLVARGPDSLTVLRDDTREAVSLHRREVNSLEVSTGHLSTDIAMTRGSILGGAVGIGGGALLGTVMHHEDDPLFTRRGAAAIGAAVFGLAGVFVGGAVGWLAAGEQWKAVPLTPAVSAGPRGGVGVALSLTL